MVIDLLVVVVWSVGGWSRRRQALGGGLLLGDLLEGVAEVAQRARRTGRPVVASGACDAAGQLGQQDLARRQRGEPRDAVGVDRPVAEDGAGDPDDLLYGRVASMTALAVAASSLAERDRGRADEQRVERRRRPSRRRRSASAGS